MKIQVSAASAEEIAPLRELYRERLQCQIVHHTAHDRKDCVQSYFLTVDGITAGYGSVWVGDYWMPKGSVFEFYVGREHGTALFPLFDEFVRAIQPPQIYAQTNDPYLGVLIYDYVQKIMARHILFADRKLTNHSLNDAVFRRSTPEDVDRIFKHQVEPVGDWVLEKDGQIIATGGVLYHYNRPYGDIFMEVDEAFRRRGYGRVLVQELKRICYEAGSVPGARTGPTNVASRRTLESAGFAPCGRLIHGETIPLNQASP